MHLFKLIKALDDAKIPIKSEEMNLPSLQENIKKANICVNDDADSELMWFGNHIRYGDYCIVVVNKDNKVIADISDTDVIRHRDRNIEIISIDEIGSGEHDFNVVVQDTETRDKIVYDATEFMEFFKLDSTTYVYNSVRDRMHQMQ